MTENEYSDQLYIKIKHLLEEEWKTPKHYQTLDQWVSSTQWVRGRSGNNPNTVIEMEGKQRRTRAMKSLDAVFYSDDDIKKRVKETRPDIFNIQQKSEHGKIRPVVKCSNWCNQQWDFLLDYVERGLVNAKFSRLYNKISNIEEHDLELWQSTIRDTWKLPMDHSRYDHQQTIAMIKAALMAIYDVVTSNMANDLRHDFDDVWRAAWDSQFGDVTVNYKDKHFKWGNGLPSGVRGTAIIGTLLNIGSFMVMKDILEQTTGTSKHIKSTVVQGDDIACETTTLTVANDIVLLMQHLGYKVHPQKTFISKERTEFLKRSIETTGITGYIPRTFLAIRFRSPILEPPVIKAERMFSRFTLWHLCGLRGANMERTMECFLSDCEQMGVERKQAVRFALTPRAYNGIGVSERTRMYSYLYRFWDGKWVSIKITKKMKNIKAHLGAWVSRMKKWGLRSANIDREEEMRITNSVVQKMVPTWGIRQKDIWQDIKVEFEEKNVEIPRPERMPYVNIIRPEEVWNLDDSPIMLRNDIKHNDIRTGQWTHIKPEYITELKRLQKRVSKTIFELWIMGEIKMSLPVVDKVAMKYGNNIKVKMQNVLDAYIFKKDMTIERLQGVVHHLEKYAAILLSNNYPDITG